MYQTILVPVDISEPALTRLVIPYVEDYARSSNARFHFLSVIPSVPYYLAYSSKLPGEEELKNQVLSRLNEDIKQFNIPANRTETHVMYGPPKDQVLKLAETLQADLIIIASHHPDITTYLLGSNAAAIVRLAECPVLVIR